MVVVTMRPDTDASNSGWTDQAGGTTNIYGTVDEATATDTDYVRSSANPTADIIRFRMSDPGVGLVGPFNVSYRYGIEGTGTLTITVRLKQGTTVIKSWVHTDATNTFATVTQTLSSGELASITDFNDLFVEFEAGPAGFTPTSTESSNYLTRATGITSDTDKTRYDALITGLVTDGLFSKLDVLYIFAAPTRATAVLNLVSSSYAATEVGTPASWTASVGYTGDGSTFYLDTGANPVPAGVPWAGQYQLDSASVGFYVHSSATSGESYLAMGSSDAGDSWLVPCYFGTALYRINDQTTGSVAVDNTSGLWIATRTASNARALYRNGNTTAIQSDATTSVNLPRQTFYIFAANNVGTAQGFVTVQMSAGFIGSKLTNTEQAALAARINTFMTAYGINVY